MNNYKLTIGLEIHAELKTKTKMFCDSKNDADETRPNANVCPVCMGYPGTLPVINKEAVRQVLRLGLAVGGEIANYTEFDRKNYFYPDIPKGYQISQYKYPLVRGGELAEVELTRIHLEEDTARSSHEGNASLVDFNRAGVPLMELVTEPVIDSAEKAAAFAKELQLALRYLGMSDANMEKGEMRVEANISVSKAGPSDPEFSRSDLSKLGTKVEVKNLNSFKAVEKAIKFEFERHVALIERGEKILQETRGWDETKEETFSQRTKEDSHDYRYFPDPDLPKLFISDVPEFSAAELGKTMPELPWQRRERYLSEFGLKAADAELYVREPEWGSLFESVAGILADRELSRLASNYITSDIKKPVPAGSLAEVARMISSGEISSRGAKDILKVIEDEGGNPRKIAEDRNLMQKSDEEELKNIAGKIISENPKAEEEYRKGKSASLQFLIGQAMKEMKGSGNPQMLKKIFEELLK